MERKCAAKTGKTSISEDFGSGGHRDDTEREEENLLPTFITVTAAGKVTHIALNTVCVDVQTTRVPQELSQLQNVILLSFRSNVDDTKERKGKERKGKE